MIKKQHLNKQQVKTEQYKFGSENKSFEFTLLKDYQQLKIQVKQLSSQNKYLNDQVKSLKRQKAISESRYFQNISIQEDIRKQVQQQKNYQIELLKLKKDQQMNELKRQFKEKMEETLRQIKNKQEQIKQKNVELELISLRNCELNKKILLTDQQSNKNRDSNNQVKQSLFKQQAANKELKVLVQQLQIQKIQMEAEIRILLEIQTDKSKTINYLENQIKYLIKNQQIHSQTLNQKINQLLKKCNSLEENQRSFKDKFINAERLNKELQGLIQNNQQLIKQKESLIQQHNQKYHLINKNYQENLHKQRCREQQITQLMSENQRLYKQLNITRHKLREVCMNHGINF